VGGTAIVSLLAAMVGSPCIIGPIVVMVVPPGGIGQISWVTLLTFALGSLSPAGLAMVSMIQIVRSQRKLARFPLAIAALILSFIWGTMSLAMMR
jgi:hypothetical protein